MYINTKNKYATVRVDIKTKYQNNTTDQLQFLRLLKLTNWIKKFKHTTSEKRKTTLLHIKKQ